MTKKNLPTDITAFATQFETLLARNDDDTVALFELLGISDGTLNAHRQRIARVEHNKGLARRLNEFKTAHATATDALRIAIQSREVLEKRIAEQISKLQTLQSVNPPTSDVSQQVASLAPQNAKDQTQLVKVEEEVATLKRELQVAETNLISAQRALDDLAKPQNLPIAVQVALRQARSVRRSSDDRLLKVQQLLVWGRAALTIQAKEYNVRAGDRPALGALEQFIRARGIPFVNSMPTLFDESGARMHGDGLFKPFKSEIEATLALLRDAVANLTIEESQLLAAASSGFVTDVETAESVYARSIKAELAIV